MSGAEILALTVLGCGSSAGTPRIGGDWGACDPKEPRNRRSRSSILVERGPAGAGPDEKTIVLIDTSPDLREQLLRAGVSRLDAVLYTHDHADQTHGIDDLRVMAMTMRRRIPVYMDELTAATLMQRFAYCFEAKPDALYPPILDARVDLKAGRETVIDGPGGPIGFLALDQAHGPTRSLGFRFGEMAYCNDVSDLPEASLERLEGLKLWVVDALRYTSHISHAHLDRSLAWIERLRPERALLTNLHVDMDYRRLAAETPDGVEPAYDGLTVELPITAHVRPYIS